MHPLPLHSAHAFVAIVLSVVALAAPSPSRAQIAVDAADTERLVEEANGYFELGEYLTALGLYQQAWQQSHRVELIYSIALCQQQLERWSEAALSLEHYLRLASPENRAALQSLLLRLRVLASEPSRSDDSDARQWATTETTDEQHAEDAGSGHTEQEGDPQSPDATPFIVAMSSLAAAGAALVVFGVLGGLALAEDSRLTRSCSPYCAPGAANDLVAYSLGADVAAGIALAAGIAGLVALAFVPSGPPRTGLAASVTSQHLIVAVGGTW